MGKNMANSIELNSIKKCELLMRLPRCLGNLHQIQEAHTKCVNITFHLMLIPKNPNYFGL